MYLVLMSVLKDLAWSFLAKPVLMKAAFGILKWGASRSDNELDDQIVRDAESAYYNKKEK